MPAIIFSIDNEASPVIYHAFMGYIADRAPCVAAIGCYKGQTEKAFIMDAAEFDKHVKDSGFVTNQESFLYVASGNKMEATLFYPASGKRVAIGCMHSVDAETALASDAWTYRPDLGVYWIARKGNPDKVRKHKKPATLKVLELSTGHLPRETVQRIEDGEFHNPMQNEYGFLFPVLDQETDCASMNACLDYAKKQGCGYVLFDRDVEAIGELPTFDW